MESNAVTALPPEAVLLPSRGRRLMVAAWASWDWGSAAYNAVIVSFIYSVYVTDVVGRDIEGPLTASTWLAIAMACAGLVIAVLAPVTGQRADAGGHRRRSVGIWTAVTVAVMVGLFFIESSPGYFPLALVLLAAGSVTFQFAEVSYFAMIRQVSTPATIGRISAFGWAAGYFGGIVLLLVCYLGFIEGEGDTRGMLHISTAEGMNIRVIALVAAAWFAVFAIPVLFAVPRVAPSVESTERQSVAAAYRKLIDDVRALARSGGGTIRFLIASAIFRDGLAGVFTFGAILAATVYGFSAADVLLFGIAANVVSALGAVAAGFFDDALGPKVVIVASLIAMVAAMLILATTTSTTIFWILGLTLTAFVGPAQSASRTYLARLTPPGQEGQMFGLYATTGRAVSFLAPTLFGVTAYISGNDRFGILGIAAVLALGLVILLRVPRPVDRLVVPAP